MVRGLRSIVIILLCSTLLTSCFAHSHRVGGGPNGMGTEQSRQYYWLFGSFRLNEVDTQRMAGDLSGYEVVTDFDMYDFFISIILLPLTISTRSVTVNT